MFDDKFFKKDFETLSRLAHASHYLELEVLSDKLCGVIAENISKFPPEEKKKFLKEYDEHMEVYFSLQPLSVYFPVACLIFLFSYVDYVQRCSE